MLNEKDKREFIKEASLTNAAADYYLTSVFNHASETELALGKDIRNWNSQEIITYYKMQFYTAFSTIKLLHTMLCNYVEWCLRHNLVEDSRNHFDELSTKTIMSCVNTALAKTGIFTREQLLSNIESFSNVSDKFLVLGLFEGLMGKGMSDFWDITDDNIDGNKITLNGSGRVLVVSNELIRYARESMEEYSYHPFINLNDNTVPADKSFDPEDPRVIKAMWNTTKEDDTILRRRMMNRLARLTRNDEQPYRRNLLMESGRIDMLRILMKEDDNKNIREVYKKHKEEIEYRYSTIYDLGSWILQYSQYLE